MIVPRQNSAYGHARIFFACFSPRKLLMLPGRIWYMADVQKRGQVSRGMLAILRLGFVCADRGGQAMWARPFGATLHSGSIEQLGGASEDARSYWQGRFAACALVERFWHTGRPWNSWGVAPNPTRGAASGLRKGQTKRDEVPPLTPFARLNCSLFLTSSACCSFVFFPYFNLSINDVAPNRSGSPSHSAHVAPISA